MALYLIFDVLLSSSVNKKAIGEAFAQLVFGIDKFTRNRSFNSLQRMTSAELNCADGHLLPFFGTLSSSFYPGYNKHNTFHPSSSQVVEVDIRNASSSLLPSFFPFS